MCTSTNVPYPNIFTISMAELKFVPAFLNVRPHGANLIKSQKGTNMSDVLCLKGQIVVDLRRTQSLL